MQHRNLISILRKICKFLLESYDGDSYKSPLITCNCIQHTKLFLVIWLNILVTNQPLLFITKKGSTPNHLIIIPKLAYYQQNNTGYISTSWVPPTPEQKLQWTEVLFWALIWLQHSESLAGGDAQGTSTEQINSQFSQKSFSE